MKGVSKTAVLTLRARADEHARPEAERYFADARAHAWSQQLPWPSELDRWYTPFAQAKTALRAYLIDMAGRKADLIVGSMLYAYMFPPMLLAIPLLSIFAGLGLADSLWSVIAAHCTLTIPLGVWLLWGFFKVMPLDLEEAAMVDGCTRAGAFFRVVLPLSLPGIVTVAIFAFLLSWTDYIFAFVLVSSDSQKTLPVGLASILGTFDARWGELMAGATLIALPLLVLFTFLSRYFIQGLAAGAMKG